jgi:phage shock protein E
MKTILPILCLLLGANLPLSADEAKPAATATAPAAVKNVTPDEVEKLVAEKKATVLDIRTPAEFAAGHIAGAVNVDFLGGDFDAKLGALDKSKTYVVHCASGGRSGRSLPKLEAAKFGGLLHMNGGFKAWTAAGKPVEKN